MRTSVCVVVKDRRELMLACLEGILEQQPDRVVAWSSVGEVFHRGRVRFTPEGANRTKVDAEIEWQPEDFVEKVGAALQLDDLQVQRDLRKFKEFIEERNAPTGAWRGEVHGGVETSTDETL